MKNILLLIPFLLVLHNTSGQSYNDEEFKVKKFDRKKWKEVVGNQDYEEDVEKRKKSSKEPSAPWFPSIDPMVFKTIAYALVLGLFAFILYYVARHFTPGRKVKNIKPATDITAPVEDIQELDTEALLKNALAQGDLRLAIRIHYLLLLKKLNEVGLIAWKKDKTNREYLSELYGRNDCYDDVRMLTLAYEIVWYGERSVSSDSFQKLSGDFESVNRRVTEATPAP